MAVTTIPNEHDERNNERAEYRLYFAIAYPIFLMAVIIGRLIPGRRRVIRSAAARASIFRETSDAVYSALPWVFSGR